MKTIIQRQYRQNQDPDKCTLCAGPWHPAVGHYVSETRHWCGVCTRDMIQLLKSMTPRRWGGLRFYDHAQVPTGTRDLDPE